MKKFLCFAAAALTLFAACQKTTVVYDNDGPQEIAVFAVNKVATKAPVSGTAFPEDYDMNIAAYLAAGGEQQGDYFNGTVFTLPQDGDAFKGGRYWPITASTLNFLAVTQPQNSNYTGTVSVVFGDEDKDFANKAVVTFANNQTVQPVAEDEVAGTTASNGKFNQFDLMYAAGQAKSTTNNGTGSYDDVNLVFAHALSWINFTVAKNDVAANITVNSIKLNGAYYGGTLTLTNDNYATAEADLETGAVVPATGNTTATWSVTGQTAVDDVFVPNGSADSKLEEKTYASKNESANDNAASVVLKYDSEETGDEPQAFGNGLLVVPFNYSTEGATPPSFIINYTIDQDGTEVTTNDINTFDFTYNFDNTTSWDLSKKYTYNIVINLNEIQVTPTVEDWKTSETAEEETINYGGDINIGGPATESDSE